MIHHATRMVEIDGVTPNPGGKFMGQVARNLTDSVDGFLRDMQFLVVMNSFAERFVQSVKRDCLSKMILFGERHLRRVLGEFVEHYHAERPHQGTDNKLITPTDNEPPNGQRVVVDERLGGLLRSYRRAA